MQSVNVSQNTMGIRLLDVDQNVSATQNAQEIKHAKTTNAKILALALVELTRFALSLLMYQLAHAHLEQAEILSNIVLLFKKI